MAKEFPKRWPIYQKVILKISFVYYKKYRSNRPVVLYEKDVLENFAKFHRKTPEPEPPF